MQRWGIKKDMTGDDPEPPYLLVGTEVSAKYKGAFCEAKIRKVVKSVKCKIQFRNESGLTLINDDDIIGVLVPGATVEVKKNNSDDTIEGTIVKIQDFSQYTVVFDDGDIATLRRSALCLKSGRHFAESETLDQLPLTHPEHFSTPVMSSRGNRRKDDIDDSDDDEKSTKFEKEEHVGRIVCVETTDKKKSKDNWFPGLIVNPNARDNSSSKIEPDKEYVVRSFKDERYYTVPKQEVKIFTRDTSFKVENSALQHAIEKAITYMDTGELPNFWEKSQLFTSLESTQMNEKISDSSKNMDETEFYSVYYNHKAGNKKHPQIASKDVDLFKFHTIVMELGGYNRVTNRSQWKIVALKFGCSTKEANNLQKCYKKHLHSLEGMDKESLKESFTPTKGRPGRPSIRDREKLLGKTAVDKTTGSSSNTSVVEKVESNSIISSNVGSSNVEVELKNPSPSHVVHQPTTIKKEVTKGTTVELKISRVDDVVNCGKNNSYLKVGIAQLGENIKQEVTPVDRKIERKSMKLITRIDDGDILNIKSDSNGEKKIDGRRKVKPVEKRVKKTETTIKKVKEKSKGFGIKEKIKNIAKKINSKISNSMVSTGDQDKLSNKKQKSNADNSNIKVASPIPRNRLKDELTNSQLVKSRKLSVGSNDSRSSSSGPTSSDRKFNPNNNSLTNSFENTSLSPATNKIKKNANDDGPPEQPKRKSAYRKKKDEEKASESISFRDAKIDFVPYHKNIIIGDKLKVYYERTPGTHDSKMTYDAKVINKKYGSATEYLVHYTGWNTRYDEWIRRSRIAENLSWTPSRSKKKIDLSECTVNTTVMPNQNEITSNSVSPNVGKLEKIKQTSVSPVVKKSATKLSSIKSGLKDIKEKEPDNYSLSSSEDEYDNSKMIEKVCNKTDKKKQAGEDIQTSNNNNNKNKTAVPLKRTRSGSVPETKGQPIKKRKTASPECKKKINTIKNVIMKTIGPRKRAYARTKDGKVQKRSNSPSSSENSSSSQRGSDLDEKSDEFTKSPKTSNVNSSNYLINENTNTYNSDIDSLSSSSSSSPTTLLYKMPPKTCVETLPSSTDFNTPLENANEEFPKITNTCATTFCSTPDSYLTEEKIGESEMKINSITNYHNITPEEKCITPIKDSSRASFEKLPVVKSGNTIFTSRSPLSEKKAINDRTPEKSLSSYLNFDKIDLLKKSSTPEKGAFVTVEDDVDEINGSNESAEIITTENVMNDVDRVVKSKDDVYEFNEEPESSDIDDRTMLHRRHIAHRSFEELPAVVKDDDTNKSIVTAEIDVALNVANDDESVTSLENEVVVDIFEEKSINITTAPLAEKDDIKNEHTLSEDEDNNIVVEEINTSILLDVSMDSDETEKCVSAIINTPLDSTEQKETSNEDITSIVEHKFNDADHSKDDNNEEDDDDDDNDDGNNVALKINEEMIRKSTPSPSFQSVNCVTTEENLEIFNVTTELEEDEKYTPTNTINVCKAEQSSDINTLPDEIDLHVDCKESSSIIDQQSVSESSMNTHIDIDIEGEDDKIETSIEELENLEKHVINDDSDKDVVKRSDSVAKELLCEEPMVLNSPEFSSILDKERIVAVQKIADGDNDFEGSNNEEINVTANVNECVISNTNDMISTSSENNFESIEISTTTSSPNGDINEASETLLSLNVDPTVTSTDVETPLVETASDTSSKPVEKVKKNNSEILIWVRKNQDGNDEMLKKKTFNDCDKLCNTSKRKSKSHSRSSPIDFEKNCGNDTNQKTVITPMQPNLISTNYKPSIANFMATIPADFDTNQRIEFMEQKLQELRKRYNENKQEVAIIDKKRRKLRRKEREGRIITRNEANSFY